MSTQSTDPLALLQQRLGHRFRDAGLLQDALTHRSWGQPNNERLEFLGDSVLNCAVSRLLFDRFQGSAEGDLSRLRASLVRQETLVERAGHLGLAACLRLGESEARTDVRASILGDALESVLGAVYLDAGFDAALAVIGALWTPLLTGIDPATHGKDAKTRLQEILQAQALPVPAYRVAGTRGAAHAQVFEVECVIDALAFTVAGQGASRRAAEQDAARRACERIDELLQARGDRRARRKGKA